MVGGEANDDDGNDGDDSNKNPAYTSFLMIVRGVNQKGT